MDQSSGDRTYDLLTEEEISAGRATAAYFLRTEEILDAAGADPEVVAELHAPPGWHLLAGLKDVARLLEGVPVDVDAPPEGTPVGGGPVLRIEGPYRAFARYESPLLGFLAHASGVATAAWRACALADGGAGGARVLSFGTRRQHPALGAMVERSALIGGVDGVGNVAGAELLGREAGGTMPHALVLCLGDPERAWAAFDDALDPAVPRTMLCDTLGDEADEAGRALALLGSDLDAVRVDTPRSRRGDFREILEDIRWELDRRGGRDVEVVASGGVDAGAIRRLRDVVDVFGVGSAIADADPVDLSLNVVAVEGEPRAKRGVRPGAKEVYRDGYDDAVVPADANREPPGEPLFEPLLRDGELVRSFSLEAAADRAAAATAPLRERGAFVPGTDAG